MATQVAHPQVASRMAQACNDFLSSLDPDQRAKATYAYLDGERVFWYYAPLNRHGLPLRDMDESQRELARAILASGLADRAYEQARQIIDLETHLGEIEHEEDNVTWARDPELYYFTVFGEPGGEEPWGWRAEGHHVCLNYSVWGDRVISMTPLFLGSNPAEVRKGPDAGRRILGAVEDLAFELMDSLDAGQRSRAILYDKAPRDILTFSAIRASLPEEQGVPASKLTDSQRAMLMALLAEYLRRVPEDLSRDKLEWLKEEGLQRLHVAWGGPVAKGVGHYYRIHGGNFMVEFDNQQNEANHIHSVWRDVDNDFATDVLRDHLLLYHVL